MYKVEVDRSVAKDIERLPPKHQRQVLAKMDSLATNPRPQDCKALKGRLGGYRVDSGEYRVIYSIDDSALLVIVALVKHRRDAYR